MPEYNKTPPPARQSQAELLAMVGAWTSTQGFSQATGTSDQGQGRYVQDYSTAEPTAIERNAQPLTTATTTQLTTGNLNKLQQQSGSSQVERTDNGGGYQAVEANRELALQMWMNDRDDYLVGQRRDQGKNGTG